MKDLPVLMKSGEGDFLVPMKIIATVNSHSSCQVPWLSLCQPLHPLSASRDKRCYKHYLQRKKEAERGLGIRLVGLTPKPMFRPWW